MSGPDLDTAIGESLVNMGEVLHVAREAIKRLNNNNREMTTGGVGQEALKLGPTVHRSAGERAVSIDFAHGPAFGFCEPPTESNLSLDGLFGLMLGGISRIDRHLFHARILDGSDQSDRS